MLDTHVLLWIDSGDRKLGRKARTRLEHSWSQGQVAVPSIVFWETALLAARGRVRLPAPVLEWRASLLAAGLLELPLDGEIAIRTLDLENLHEDPGDRFILATALVHRSALMTADERLLDWRHPLERHDARI